MFQKYPYIKFKRHTISPLILDIGEKNNTTDKPFSNRIDPLSNYLMNYKSDLIFITRGSSMRKNEGTLKDLQ